MKLASGIALLFIVTSQGPVAHPAIHRTAGGVFELVLPPAVQSQLEKDYPGFQEWPLAHYHVDVRTGFDFTSHQLPSAVVADFNGDGVPDVVLAGHTASRSLIVCLLSRVGRYETVAIADTPYTPRPDAEGAIEALMYQKAGLVGDASRPIARIRYAGFHVVWWEKAGELYFWKDGSFHKVMSSD